MKTRHLFAILVGHKMYRDTEERVMDDAQFEEIVQWRPLPRGTFAYHSDSDLHWQEVLKIEPLRQGCIRDEVAVILGRMEKEDHS